MKFAGEILAGGNGGHAVLVPAAVAKSFSRKSPRVLAVVNGIEYHTRIARYGGRSYLGLRQELLRSIGLDTGDTATVELTEEAEPEPETPQVPSEPAELTAALTADPAARTAFEALPPDHRHEYLRWIAGGTDNATRSDRVTRTLRRLHI